MNDLSLARLKTEQTHQLTTFNLERRSKTVSVSPGERVTVGEVSGRGYVHQLWLTFPGWFWQHWNQQAAISTSILKSLILRIYWDGSDTPAVHAPACDFFGMGLQEAGNFANQYFGTSSGGFFCKFPMPFRQGFRIEIENIDEHLITEVFLNALYQLDDNLPDDAAYFHAQFTTDREMQQTFEIASVEGRGHFVGCALSMQGQRMNDFSFLEAPEYVYIDDDWETPRIVGTGLEDYFLGGWYFRQGEFTGPLHGVPLKDALRSSIVMYRIHEADALRFEKRLRFTFTHPWTRENINPFFYSSVSYLYLDSASRPERNYTIDQLLAQYRVRDTDHQSMP